MDSPWLRIWIDPRGVIREAIIQRDQKREWLLAVLFGLTLGLEQASLRELGDDLPFSGILIFSILFSPIIGFLYWYLVAGMAYWIGRSFDGTGTWEDVKTAVIWASAPFIMKLILWAPQLAFFGEEMFQSSMTSLETNPWLYLLFVILWLVDLIIVVWYVVVLCKSVGEAHSFSAWRSFSSLLVGNLLFMLPLLMVAMFFRL